jgi:hypothetical protein
MALNDQNIVRYMDHDQTIDKGFWPGYPVRQKR